MEIPRIDMDTSTNPSVEAATRLVLHIVEDLLPIEQVLLPMQSVKSITLEDTLDELYPGSQIELGLKFGSADAMVALLLRNGDAEAYFWIDHRACCVSLTTLNVISPALTASLAELAAVAYMVQDITDLLLIKTPKPGLGRDWN